MLLLTMVSMRDFPSKYSKSRTAVLQNLTTRAESFLRLKRETKKQTNLTGNSSLLIDLIFLRLEKVLFFLRSKAFSLLRIP